MTPQTVLATDARGETRWADISDCPRWDAERIDVQERLYLTEGRWVLWTQDTLAMLTGRPAAVRSMRRQKPPTGLIFGPCDGAGKFTSSRRCKRVASRCYGNTGNKARRRLASKPSWKLRTRQANGCGTYSTKAIIQHGIG